MILIHHGIKGQKWGIRRYQNKDGTLTEIGRKRYDKYAEKRTAKGKYVRSEEDWAKREKRRRSGETVVKGLIMAGSMGYIAKNLINDAQTEKAHRRTAEAMRGLQREHGNIQVLGSTRHKTYRPYHSGTGKDYYRSHGVDYGPEDFKPFKSRR